MGELKEKLTNYLENIEKNEKKGNKINSFIYIREKKELFEEVEEIEKKIKEKKAGKLAGKIIAIKSCINVKGLPITCASKTLRDYIGTYDATVIKKIKNEDGLIIGMTNMDEFACGSSGETSAYGPTNNPSALGYIPGGSSSGSAAAVAANFCDISLGTDTGGSIRNPSSHCGVVGIKPTYSSVSRYGLIDLSMSLDQIGPIAKNVYDAALMLNIIKGYDEKDPISQDSPEIKLEEIEKIQKKITIGLIEIKGIDSRIKNLLNKKIDKLIKECSWKTKKIKIPIIELAIETYYPLVYVEFFSATRKFDGRKYGLKIENSAGPEVLRRILGGKEITKSEYKGRYYYKALIAKKYIKQEFSKIFKKVDCVITPTTPKLPHKIGEKINVEEMYKYDSLTIPSNLAENCAITIPIGKIDNKPVGAQIICDRFQENKMIKIAMAMEKLKMT